MERAAIIIQKWWKRVSRKIPNNREDPFTYEKISEIENKIQIIEANGVVYCYDVEKLVQWFYKSGKYEFVFTKRNPSLAELYFLICKWIGVTGVLEKKSPFVFKWKLNPKLSFSFEMVTECFHTYLQNVSKSSIELSVVTNRFLFEMNFNIIYCILLQSEDENENENENELIVYGCIRLMNVYEENFELLQYKNLYFLALVYLQFLLFDSMTFSMDRSGEFPKQWKSILHMIQLKLKTI